MWFFKKYRFKSLLDQIDELAGVIQKLKGEIEDYKGEICGLEKTIQCHQTAISEWQDKYIKINQINCQLSDEVCDLKKKLGCFVSLKAIKLKKNND